MNTSFPEDFLSALPTIINRAELYIREKPPHTSGFCSWLRQNSSLGMAYHCIGAFQKIIFGPGYKSYVTEVRGPAPERIAFVESVLALAKPMLDSFLLQQQDSFLPPTEETIQ